MSRNERMNRLKQAGNNFPDLNYSNPTNLSLVRISYLKRVGVKFRKNSQKKIVHEYYLFNPVSPEVHTFKHTITDLNSIVELYLNFHEKCYNNLNYEVNEFLDDSLKEVNDYKKGLKVKNTLLRKLNNDSYGAGDLITRLIDSENLNVYYLKKDDFIVCFDNEGSWILLKEGEAEGYNFVDKEEIKS